MAQNFMSLAGSTWLRLIAGSIEPTTPDGAWRAVPAGASDSLDTAFNLPAFTVDFSACVAPTVRK